MRNFKNLLIFNFVFGLMSLTALQAQSITQQGNHVTLVGPLAQQGANNVEYVLKNFNIGPSGPGIFSLYAHIQLFGGSFSGGSNIPLQVKTINLGPFPREARFSVNWSDNCRSTLNNSRMDVRICNGSDFFSCVFFDPQIDVVFDRFTLNNSVCTDDDPCDIAQNDINSVISNTTLTDLQKLKQFVRILENNPNCDLNTCF